MHVKFEGKTGVFAVDSFGIIAEWYDGCAELTDGGRRYNVTKFDSTLTELDELQPGQTWRFDGVVAKLNGNYPEFIVKANAEMRKIRERAL